MHQAQCCVCDLPSVHPDISGCNLTGFQCTNGGLCQESSGGSFCHCATGFTGAQCAVGKSSILALKRPVLCALRDGNQISMKAILACHPDLVALNGWLECNHANYDISEEALFILPKYSYCMHPVSGQYPGGAHSLQWCTQEIWAFQERNVFVSMGARIVKTELRYG